MCLEFEVSQPSNMRVLSKLARRNSRKTVVFLLHSVNTSHPHVGLNPGAPASAIELKLNIKMCTSRMLAV